MALGTWLILAELGAALQIQTGSPDALCPDLTQTREAVASRLGTLDVSRGGWVASYTIGHSPDATKGDFVRLVLRDPAGTTRLERDLPLDPGACSTMARAIAVVLDRYFRSLERGQPEATPTHEGEEPEREIDSTAPAAATLPDSLATAATGPTEAVTVAPGSAGRSPARAVGRAERHLWGGLLGAHGVEAESFAVELLLAVALWRYGRFGLDLELPLGPEREAVEEEWVRLWSAPLRVWLGLGATRERWWLYGGPELLLAVEVGSGAGLSRSDRASRILPGVGANLGAGLRLGRWFGLGLHGAVDATFPSATHQFVVNQALPSEREVLAPRPFRGSLAVGAFFRI